VKSAAKMFKRYVRPNENLLKAKLVCFLIWTSFIYLL
jgi:hypothetical protein